MQIWYRWLLKYGREFIWGILITKTILAIILLSNLHMIKIEPLGTVQKFLLNQ